MHKQVGDLFLKNSSYIKINYSILIRENKEVDNEQNIYQSFFKR